MGAIAERRQEKFRTFLSGELKPGERIDAALSFAQTGPSPWMGLLTTLYILWIKYLGVAVTGDRVIVVRRSKLTNKIKSVDRSVPRADVSVEEWTEGKLFSTLRLNVAGEPLKLNVHRMHRPEGTAVVDALTSGSPAPWKGN